jgi:tetratricopeptide (TPR) repeat protein
MTNHFLPLLIALLGPFGAAAGLDFLGIESFPRERDYVEASMVVEPRDEQHLQRVESLVKEGKLDSALAIAAEEARRDPDSARSVLWAATISSRLALFEQAADYYERALQLQDLQAPTLAVAARANRYAGRVDRGRALLRAAQDKDPFDLPTQYVGALFAAIDDPSARRVMDLEYTLAHLTQVIDWIDEESLPSDKNSPIQETLFRAIFGEEALAGREEADRVWKEYVQARRAENRKRVLTKLHHLRDLGFDLPAIASEQVILLRDFDRTDEANAVLAQGLETHPDSLMLNYLHAFLPFEQGHYAQAAERFQRGLKTYRDHPRAGPALFGLAASWIAADDEDRLDEAWDILFALGHSRPRDLLRYMEGDLSYLRAIRADDRYDDLLILLAE